MWTFKKACVFISWIHVCSSFSEIPFAECDILSYRYRVKRFVIAGLVFFIHYVREPVWIQTVDTCLPCKKPFTILLIRSTRKQLSNCGPIFAMFPYCLFQLCVFFWWPFTRLLRIGRIHVEASLTILIICSTGNQRSNCGPLFAMFLYRFVASDKYCIILVYYTVRWSLYVYRTVRLATYSIIWWSMHLATSRGTMVVLLKTVL